MTHKLPHIHIWTNDDVASSLDERQADSYKGSFGTALLVAGSTGMPGAALLAGTAALRSGVGKLEIGTASATMQAIAQATAEATYYEDALLDLASGLLPIDSYKVIACGPGTKADGVMEAAVQTLLASSKPLILDAGALSDRVYPKRSAPTVLTPHAGEFARISRFTLEQIQQSPAACAHAFAVEQHVTLVLKGPGTTIAFPDGRIYQNSTGNSGLAKGGSGDVLTGLLLGLSTCQENLDWAVLNAVFLHGACADEFVKTGSAHTMVASDIPKLLPFVWKRYERKGIARK